MAEENNVSQFSVDIGTFEEDENCPKVQLCVDINTEIANETQQTLLAGVLSKDFTEFSVALALSAVEGREDDLKGCLDAVFSDPNYAGKIAKPMRKDILVNVVYNNNLRL